MMEVSSFPLRNGVNVPSLGLGLYKVRQEHLKLLTPWALNAGYRLFDTASYYGNEKDLGKELSKAFKEGKVARQDVFLTSKVWNDQQGYDNTLRAFETSLKKLNLDYLDLYLIHWPIMETMEETWKALVTLYNERLVRAIGVSNFHIHHLQKIMASSSHYPQLNQIEMHPYLTQQELLTFCESHSIAVQAWSPLGRGRFLTHPLLEQLAEQYRKTIPQVILRWHLQRGILTIPKTTHKEYLLANIDIFDFQLSLADMEAITELNQNLRYGPDPESFSGLKQP